MADDEIKPDEAHNQTKACESVEAHVQSFFAYTTMHGFGRLTEARGISWHVFWIVMLVAAHCAFYYHTYLIITEFLDRPIRTKISMKHGKKLQFPTVTLCNLNMLRKSEIPSDLMENILKIVNSTTGVKNAKNITRKTASQTALPNPDLKHDSQVQFELLQNLYNDYDQKKLEEYGHQFKNMVLDCSFNGEDCGVYPDEVHTWRHIWLESIGNCYMFNRALDDNGNDIEPFKSSLPGHTNGLKLLLNIEQYDYLGEVSPYAGMKMVIGAQGQMPFPLSHGIDIMPGLSTGVDLRMYNNLRLDPFKNNSCQMSDKFDSSSVYKPYNMSYSKLACKYSCLTLMQTSKCQCAQFRFKSIQKYDSCDFTNKSVVGCLEDVYNRFLDGGCDERCPPPCSEAYFTTTISSSKWPANNYKEKLLKSLQTNHKLNMTSDEISDNVMELHVYYAELDYVRVEETLKYGTQDIMSNIGGQLGIWVGVSALSIAEFIELIYIVVSFLINKSKKRNETSGSKQTKELDCTYGSTSSDWKDKSKEKNQPNYGFENPIR